MASKTSEKNVVDRGTSGGKSYYNTDITTLADGSVKRETYRTDEKGNNRVLIQSTTVNSDGKVTKDDLSSNASVEEQRDLRNPKSQLRQAIKRQVDSAAGQLAEDNIDGVTKSTLDKAALGSGNAALNEVQTLDSLNTSNTTAPPSAGFSVKAAAGTRNSFGDQIFPSDLAETGMDVIKFTMLEFKPRKIGAGPGGFGRIGKRDPAKNRKSIGTVTLPVPGGITDQNNADWGDGRINPLQAAGLDVAGATLARGLEAGGGAAVDQLKALGKSATEAKGLLGGLFAAGAVGLDPNEVLARTQGAVINPNLELLFKGPALRPFNFTFQMGARNEGDSLQIMEILRFFKQGSAPQRTQAQMLIKAPHTFQIEYHHRGTKNKFLNEIKECALLSVGVNYTPNNNYATFANGAPVSIELTLGFKELDPVFNDDYQGEGVGF